MFDFGFSELIVIAVVTLIVVGPERLPKVARTAGHLLGRLQRYVSDVKSDIQREMQLEELKKLQQQVEAQARELETSMRSEAKGVEDELGRAAAAVTAGTDMKDPPASAEAVVPTETPHAEAGPQRSVFDPEPALVEGAPVVDSTQLELRLDGGEAPVRPTTPAEKA